MAQEANTELETFRKQWKEEVSARAKASSSNSKSATFSDASDQGNDKKDSHPPRGYSTLRERFNKEEHADGSDATVYHDIEKGETRQNAGESPKGIHHKNETKEEPSSALEHYEHAVERESQGDLEDSSKHYQKAFQVRIFLVFKPSVNLVETDSTCAARCGSRSSVQEQALLTVKFQFTT